MSADPILSALDAAPACPECDGRGLTCTWVRGDESDETECRACVGTGAQLSEHLRLQLTGVAT